MPLKQGDGRARERGVPWARGPWSEYLTRGAVCAPAQFQPGGLFMRAYILITVHPGKVRDIVAAVSQMEGVRRADACWGLPDVFAYAETVDERRLNELVIDQIQKLNGVERT